MTELFDSYRSNYRDDKSLLREEVSSYVYSLREASAAYRDIVTDSPEGSPEENSTARPRSSQTNVSSRPGSAWRRLVFQPFGTGLAPSQGTK